MKKSLLIIITILICLIVLGLLLNLVKEQSKKKSLNLSLKDYNLLFISIDTLRADRLNTYGYHFPTSPKIEELANKSVVFEDAISVSSWTLPTHMTFFTGLFPSAHQIDIPKKIKVSEDTVLLAELLKANSYRTFAYTGGGYVSSRYGFDRGFEKYLMARKNKHQDSFDILNNLESLYQDLDTLNPQENFFVFLHTFDIHCPFNSPEPYMYMFNSPDTEAINPKQCGNDFNKQNINTKQAKYLSDRYDGSIRFVDTKLGELFDYLEKKSLLQNTIIVVTSDHGEEFLEHGSIGHKGSLHRELIQIPLIIYVPGMEAARIKTQVSSVDLFDTILDMLEIKHQVRTNGISLWPLIMGKDNSNYPRQFQFSELDGKVILKSHINKKGHLIKNQETTEVQYYDLKKDPLEQNDYSQVELGEVKKRLHEINLLEKNLIRKEADAFAHESDEEIEQLKSLGYF